MTNTNTNRKPRTYSPWSRSIYSFYLAFELHVNIKAINPLDFPPLDLHNVPGGNVLFSRKLIEVLSNAGVTNIDYYDAEVRYMPTNNLMKYKAANIMGIVSVLDIEKSEYNASENGFIDQLLKIRIDKAKCVGLDFVRFKELPNMILISGQVREAILSAKVSGVLIIEDKEWEPGMI